MRKALTKSGRLTCPPRSACIRRFQLKGLSASFLIITVVATTLGCGSSGVKRDSPVAWILEGATLIDGTGSPPVPESVVVIEGDRIVKVGRKGDFGYPENHHITNLEGRYLLPGVH